MRKFILDTNILLRHWHRCRAGSLADKTTDDAEAWASQLIALQKTDAIVTPVYLEVVCGVVNRHEMDLTRAYLKRFHIVDQGIITEDDWKEARRLAERIPAGPQPKPRGLADCLIKAIANRLKYDVRTADAGMPRSSR